MHWQGVTDDANGIGFAQYLVFRDGQEEYGAQTPEFTDEAVTAGSTHTYTIYPQDLHGNWGAGTSFTVTLPPAGAIDPRRTGVRPLGTYWGAMGEQIDVRSGNLNFTVPILKAMGRGGWGVTFAMSYNSQQWRQDPAGIWGFGQDVGYGFGWQFMAGSITPYWATFGTLDHYIFTDSTGAEYRLEINTNGIWTSRQGIYAAYDAANQILYFPDGSFWAMGCTSAGNESDAGSMYPTQMQDTNGNQIVIRYAVGMGVSWSNSSARILEIEDVRASQTGGATYSFTYTTNPMTSAAFAERHLPYRDGGGRQPELHDPDALRSVHESYVIWARQDADQTGQQRRQPAAELHLQRRGRVDAGPLRFRRYLKVDVYHVQL